MLHVPCSGQHYKDSSQIFWEISITECLPEVPVNAHTQNGEETGGTKSSVRSYRGTILTASHRCGGIAHTTGELQWMGTSSSGRPGQEGEARELPFMWEGQVQSSASRWVMSQLRAYGSGGRPTWDTCSVPATELLIRKKQVTGDWGPGG